MEEGAICCLLVYEATRFARYYFINPRGYAVHGGLCSLGQPSWILIESSLICRHAPCYKIHASCVKIA